MSYPNTKSLIQSYSLTHRVISMQVEGLTHAESMLQLPFRGNCLNWVLGHLLVGRNRALGYLGQRPILEEMGVSRYETGSEPLTNGKNALPLEVLLDGLNQSQERIISTLSDLDHARLDEKIGSGGREHRLGELLAGLHWHETYHTGQLEILRQLTGRNDALI